MLIEQALSGRLRINAETRKLSQALLGRRLNAINVPPRGALLTGWVQVGRAAFCRS